MVNAEEIRKLTLRAFYAETWKNIPEDNVLKKLWNAAKERGDKESMSIITRMLENCCNAGYSAYLTNATKVKWPLQK